MSSLRQLVSRRFRKRKVGCAFCLIVCLLLYGSGTIQADSSVAGPRWQYRTFPWTSERFVFSITTFTPVYDEWYWLLEEDWGELSDEEWEAHWDDLNEEDGPLFTVRYEQETIYHEFEVGRNDENTVDIRTGYRYTLPRWELENPVDLFGGFFGPQLVLVGGGWVGELQKLSSAAMELRLAVGNSVETADGWLVVVDETRTVGVDGFVCHAYRWEMDENGELEAVLTSEWILSPDVGLPLSGRVYEGDVLVFSLELVEYDRQP